MPENWFYSEAHLSEKSLGWVINKSELQVLETGFYIQFFIDISKTLNQSKQDFVKSFIKTKSLNAKVLKICPETEDELFYKTCLETEEQVNGKLLHIFYGISRGKKLDWIVATTSTSPTSDWAPLAPMFQRMREFKLFELKQLEKLAGISGS